MARSFLVWVVSLSFALFPPNNFAGDNNREITELPPILVEETRIFPYQLSKEKLAAEPTSVAVIPEKTIKESPGFNFEDSFQFVPGVFLQSRNGVTEAKLSFRGTNLSSNFSFWGVTLLVDGLPINSADGFTHLESIDLLAVDHIEIYKGAQAIPFGGNSIGGAINFVLKKGRNASALQLRGEGGSYGFYQTQISSGNFTDPFRFLGQTTSGDYYVSVTGGGQDGFRVNAQEVGVRLNANLGLDIGQRHRARLRIIGTNIHNELPGGLSREQFETNPKQAGTSADDAANPIVCVNALPCGYESRNSLNHVGLSYQYRWSRNRRLTIAPFYQYWSWEYRFVQWFDQSAEDTGAEIRYRHGGSLFSKNYRFVVGFSPWYGKNYMDVSINDFGDPGTILEKRAINTFNLGSFIEGQLDVTPKFTVIGGGRWDYSTREAEKEIFLSTGTSSIRTSQRIFSAISPTLGFVYRLTPHTQLYGNVSRGYEPPTNIQMMQALNEAAESPEGAFTDVDAQRAWQFELGYRGTAYQGDLSWDVTVYDLEMQKEIVVTELTLPSGEFPVWRNAKGTRHTGIEIGGTGVLKKNLFFDSEITAVDQLSLTLSYTYRRLKFLDDITKVSGGEVVLDAGEGNDIPGLPVHWITGELRYEHTGGFWIAPNFFWSPAGYFIDSLNLVSNPPFFVINVKGGYQFHEQARLFIEGRNLSNQNYSGQVLAGGANPAVVSSQGLFLPSPPLSIFAGLELQMN